jgi:hypothetical protein
MVFGAEVSLNLEMVETIVAHSIVTLVSSTLRF